MKPCTTSDFAPRTPLAAAAAAASTHALGSTNPQYSTEPWTNQHHPHYPQTSSQQQQQQDPTTMARTAAIGIMSQDQNAKTSML